MAKNKGWGGRCGRAGLAGLGLALVLAGFARADGVEPSLRTSESTRLGEAQRALAAAQAWNERATNAQDSAAAEQALRLATDTLATLRRLSELDAQERAAQTTSDSMQVLRHRVLAVDPDIQTVRQAIRDLGQQLRDARARVDGIDQRRRELENAGDEASLLQAETEWVRQRSVEFAVEALTLQRLESEIRLRLADEATRLDAQLSELAVQTRPRPTIRALAELHRRLGDVRQARTNLAVEARQLRERSEKNRLFAKLVDERMRSLTEKEALLREQEQLLREGVNLGGESGQRRRTLLERVGLARSDEVRQVAQQGGAVREQITLCEQAVAQTQGGAAALARAGRELRQLDELFEAEQAFLAQRYAAQRQIFKGRLMLPALGIAALLALYLLYSRLLLPLVRQGHALFAARRLGGYLVVFIAILIVVAFFLDDLRAIATVMGILGAAIVIALQDLCSAFAGWFVILASGKLHVGDRVEIGDCRGDVIDIQMLRTTLLEVNNWLGSDDRTGRAVVIPNSFIFREKVFNYSHMHPFVWSRLDVTVTYESPFEEARELLLRIVAEEAAEEFTAAAQADARLEAHYGGKVEKFEPRIRTRIADSGVEFRLFYVSHFERIGSIRDRISRRVLAEFATRPALQFAYPTERQIPTPPAPVVAAPGGLPA